MTYRTTEAYVSGFIYGDMWAPHAQGAIPFSVKARGVFGLLSRGNKTLGDGLETYLSENGGDFRSAEFSADSCLTVVRKSYDAPGRYSVHMRRIPLSRIVPELVGDTDGCDLICEDCD